MRLTSTLLFTVILSFSGYAQETPADTVIVPLAESSKIIFTIRDRKDLEVLKHYNFQKLFEDIFEKLQAVDANQDSIDAVREETSVNADLEQHEMKHEHATADGEDGLPADNDEDEDGDDEGKWVKSRRGKVGQTWHSYNLDLGTNNYLQDDQFPGGSEPYAVRPWGSWYIAVNSVQRTKLGRNLFVEWALGASWYNFKFQAENTLVRKDDAGITFEADSRDVEYVKSKLSATFINASLVPVLDFGEHSRKTRIWEGHGDGFRFGLGPYVGYRIASKTKLVFEQDGDREKEKNRDNFHLNNLRYGFRLQLGVRSTDLFVNYDMNDLFAKDKGPRLNALSFGLIF